MSIVKVNTSELPQVLNVKVRSPEQVIFEGKAVAISSVNKEGKFDVIPYHTNFISIIKETLVIHETKDKNTTLTIQEGIVKIYEFNVFIYLGITTD